jgi:hypothetical protein
MLLAIVHEELSQTKSVNSLIKNQQAGLFGHYG